VLYILWNPCDNAHNQYRMHLLVFSRMKNTAQKHGLNSPLLKAVQRITQSRVSEMTALAEELVAMESPSFQKRLVDDLGGRLHHDWEKLGGTVRVHKSDVFGNHLQIDFSAGADGANRKPVMLLGHFDTVYEAGTLAKMPCKLMGDKLHGPGVYDMKGGIVMMMHAIAALREANGGVLPRPVRVWIVTDEEVGSSSSRATTEKLAKECAAVLVLEPSLGLKGALKTARKGVGSFTIKVKGVAAHSGVDFEKGASAVLELARQIERVSGFTNVKKGITINVGIIRGGTRTNVVAEQAEAEVDARISKMADAAKVHKQFMSLKPFDKRCKITVTGGINRPPLERTEKVVGLYKLAQSISKELGFKLEEKATGGGSDGNFTSALGIPTLDGLGCVGDGAHAAHEHILVRELPKRAALVAGLIAGIP
jgi:glutamate carboxypeptidase